MNQTLSLKGPHILYWGGGGGGGAVGTQKTHRRLRNGGNNLREHINL